MNNYMKTRAQSRLASVLNFPRGLYPYNESSFRKIEGVPTETHCILVGFRKAFNSLKHSRIWEALDKQGIEEKIIKVFQELYRDVKAYARTDRKEVFI